MNPIIEKIIDAGIHAPSGDNCQPWRFEVSDNEIKIYNLPERDRSVYNSTQKASAIAHGALLENMEIAAAKHNFILNSQILPDPQNLSHTFTLTLKPGYSNDYGLYESIFQRCTNRKPYQKKSLSDLEKSQLENCCPEINVGRIIINTNPFDITSLARAASLNEWVLFQNHEMHKFFFDHVLWSASQEEQKRLGFYVKTLEVPAPAMPGFKLAKNWNILKFLNKLGFNSAIAKANQQTYTSSSAVGAILIPDTKLINYFAAGKLLQRAWLTATKLNLSFQMLAGITCLHEAIESNLKTVISEKETQIINGAYNEMGQIFQPKGETIALMFRIGYSLGPSSRTYRLPPDVKII